MAKFKKGDPRPPGAGKKKGHRSALTISVKEAIETAAQGLGGAARLTAWAKELPENEKVFWGSIYPKLLPLQVTGKDGADLFKPAVELTDDHLAAVIAAGSGSGVAAASKG